VIAINALPARDLRVLADVFRAVQSADVHAIICAVSDCAPTLARIYPGLMAWESATFAELCLALAGYAHDNADLMNQQAGEALLEPIEALVRTMSTIGDMT